MNRKSIELEMPEMFPQKHYDGINEILLKKKDVHLPAWKEFAGGWNGLKFRFLSCAESNQSFIQLAKEYGGSPPFPQRYYQERELFNFFVTGFSAVECYFYALYFICFFIDANVFPYPEDYQEFRKISPKNVAKKMRKFKYKDHALTKASTRILEEDEYRDLRDIRNILAHRSSPGRTIFTGGDRHGDVIWLRNISINTKTTTEYFDWIVESLDTLLTNTHVFVIDQFIANLQTFK